MLHKFAKYFFTFLSKHGLGLVVALTFVQFISKYSNAKNNDELSISFCIIGCFAMMFIHVLLHELGHFIGGFLVGFRGGSFLVGPLYWSYIDSHWKFYFLRNRSWLGGMAGGSPRDLAGYRWKQFVMVAGGPLVSILSGIIALLVYPHVSQADTNFDHSSLVFVYLSFFLNFYGSYSLLFGLINLNPKILQSKGFENNQNDGYRLQTLLKGGDSILSQGAIAVIAGQLENDLRPKEWNSELIQKAAGDKTPELFLAYANWYAYLWALDQGDVEKARTYFEWMMRTAEAGDPDLRTAVQFEGAYFASHHLQDLERAHQFLALANQSRNFNIEQRYLAEAAIALVENKFDEAAGLAIAGIAANKLSYYSGLRAYKNDLLNDILIKAQAKGASNSEPTLTKYPPRRSIRDSFHSTRETFSFVFGTLLLFDIRNASQNSGWLSSLAIGKTMQLQFLPSLLIFLAWLLLTPLIVYLGIVFSCKKQNFSFSALQILPWLRLEKPPGFRLRLVVRRVCSLLGETGLAWPNNSDNLVARSYKNISGGLRAIMLVCSLMFIFSFRLANNTWLNGFTGIGALWLLLVCFGWLLSFVNISFIKNGWRWVVLSEGGLDAEREAARMALAAANSRFVRPKEWPSDWIAKSLDGKTEMAADVHALCCAYFWSLDLGDIEQAGKFLEEALNHTHLLPRLHWGSLLTEGIYFKAMHQANLAGAENLQKRLQADRLLEFAVDTASRLRAEAALLYLQEAFVWAEEKTKQAQKAVISSRNAGIAFAEKDLLETMLLKYQNNHY